MTQTPMIKATIKAQSATKMGRRMVSSRSLVISSEFSDDEVLSFGLFSVEELVGRMIGGMIEVEVEVDFVEWVVG